MKGPHDRAAGDAPVTARAARSSEVRADDLVWHLAVSDVGLGVELDDLEREARNPVDGAPAGPPADPASGSRLDRFEGYLLRQGRACRASVLLGVCAAGTLLLAGSMVLAAQVVLAAARALPQLLGDRPLRLHFAVAHVAVIAFMLVLLATGARPREPEAPVARRAWRQFRRGWALLWGAWLALYAWLGVVWSLAPAGSPTGLLADLGSPVADCLNVGSAGALFYLFLVLDRPSVKADGLPDRDRRFRRSLVGVSIVCGATAVLSILGRLELAGLTDFGPLAGSLLGAVSMAFFVGRLSDSHLEVRRALLAPLYFYVAIQVLWHLFVMQDAASDVANALVLCGALVLKLYLFALVSRWMQDGVLQRYFDEVAFPRLPADLDVDGPRMPT